MSLTQEGNSILCSLSSVMHHGWVIRPIARTKCFQSGYALLVDAEPGSFPLPNRSQWGGQEGAEVKGLIVPSISFSELTFAFLPVKSFDSAFFQPIL